MTTLDFSQSNSSQHSEITLIAEKYQSFIEEVYQHLHKYPELSWKESETVKFLKNICFKILTDSHLSWSMNELQGGFYIDLNVNTEFDRILFRADIDALPIQEETNLPYSSVNKGVMHACGHDMHAAMLLGALKALIENRLAPKHNIRFVFQRAEECPKQGSGAHTLVKEKIMDNISEVYGLHVSSSLAPGTFASKPGPMMAQAGSLQLRFKCSGGHVMRPESGSNAIDILNSLQLHFKDYTQRYFGTSEQTPVYLVPSLSRAGNSVNIMPNVGELIYSVRSFTSQERIDSFIAALRDSTEKILSLYSDTRLLEFTFDNGFPSLINDQYAFNKSKEIIQDQGFKTVPSPLLYSGEDFAYYLQKQRGCFWILGAHQNKWDHHTAKFSPTPSILWMGTAFWLALASNSSYDSVES